MPRTKKQRSMTEKVLLEIGQKLLDIGAGTLQGVTNFLEYPHSFFPEKARAMKYARRHHEEMYRMRRALYALRKKKLIETRKKGQQLLITLTDQGKMRILQEQMKKAPRCGGGEHVIVIFDIPESERFVRRKFRLFLKECGFRRIQQSVWACDRNLLHELHIFVRLAKIESWVNAFLVRDCLIRL